MATTYTTNYNLGKQENHADKFDMDVITDNADKIDAALTAKADKSTTYTKTEVDTALSGKQATLTTAQLDAVNSGITSADVTQIGVNENNISYITSALIECVDNGAKNLFDITKYDSVRGTTVTPLANGGATLTCTNASWTQYLKTLSCTPDNTYHLLFICDSLSASSGAVCNLFIRDGSSSGASLAGITFENGKSYDLSITPTNSNIWFGLYLNNSATSATVTANLRIMLCKESEWNVSPIYQPYAMSNVEITAWILAHS